MLNEVITFEENSFPLGYFLQRLISCCNNAIQLLYDRSSCMYEKENNFRSSFYRYLDFLSMRLIEEDVWDEELEILFDKLRHPSCDWNERLENILSIKQKICYFDTFKFYSLIGNVPAIANDLSNCDIFLFLSVSGESKRVIELLPKCSSEHEMGFSVDIPEFLNITQLLPVAGRKIIAFELTGLHINSEPILQLACYYFIANLAKSIDSVRVIFSFNYDSFYKFCGAGSEGVLNKSLLSLVKKDIFFCGLVDSTARQYNEIRHFIKSNAQKNDTVSCLLYSDFALVSSSLSGLYARILSIPWLKYLKTKLLEISFPIEEKQVEIYMDKSILLPIKKAINSLNVSLYDRKRTEFIIFSEIKYISKKFMVLCNNANDDINKFVVDETLKLIEQLQSLLPIVEEFHETILKDEEFLKRALDFCCFLIEIKWDDSKGKNLCRLGAIALIKYMGKVVPENYFDLYPRHRHLSSLAQDYLGKSFSNNLTSWNFALNELNFSDMELYLRGLIYTTSHWRWNFIKFQQSLILNEEFNLKKLFDCYDEIRQEIIGGNIEEPILQQLFKYENVLKEYSIFLNNVDVKVSKSTELASIFQEVGKQIILKVIYNLNKLSYSLENGNYEFCEQEFEFLPSLDFIKSKYALIWEEKKYKLETFRWINLLRQNWNAIYAELNTMFCKLLQKPNKQYDENFISKIEELGNDTLSILSIIDKISIYSPGLVSLTNVFSQKFISFLQRWKKFIDRKIIYNPEDLEKISVGILTIGDLIFSRSLFSLSSLREEYIQIENTFLSYFDTNLINIGENLNSYLVDESENYTILHDRFFSKKEIKILESAGAYILVARSISKKFPQFIPKINLANDYLDKILEKYSTKLQNILANNLEKLQIDIEVCNQETMLFHDLTNAFLSISQLKRHGAVIYNICKGYSNWAGPTKWRKNLDEIANLLFTKLSFSLGFEQYEILKKQLVFCQNCFSLDPYLLKEEYGFKKLYKKFYFESTVNINKLIVDVIKALKENSIEEAYAFQSKLPIISESEKKVQLATAWGIFADSLCDEISIAVALLEHNLELSVVREHLYPKLKHLCFIENRFSYFRDKDYLSPNLLTFIQQVRTSLHNILKSKKERIKLLVRQSCISDAYKLSLIVHGSSYYLRSIISYEQFSEFSDIMQYLRKNTLDLIEFYKGLSYQEYLYHSPKYLIEELNNAGLLVEYSSEISELSNTITRKFAESWLESEEKNFREKIFKAELILGCLPKSAKFVCKQYIENKKQQVGYIGSDEFTSFGFFSEFNTKDSGCDRIMVANPQESIDIGKK